MLEIWHFFDTKFWFLSNLLISTFCSKNRYQWAKGLSCCMSCLCSCLFCQVSPGLKFMQVFWRSSTSKNQHVFHFVWIIIIIVYFDNAKLIDVEVITLTALCGTHVWLQARVPNLNQLSIWNWDRAFWGKVWKGEETWKIESSGGLQLQMAAFVFVSRLEISFCRMGQWLSYVSIWHFLHKGNCWCCLWYFFSRFPFTLHVITWWQQVGLAFFQPFLSSDAKLRTLRMPLGLFKTYNQIWHL